MLYAVLKPLSVLLMRLWFRLEVRGTEHVPRSGPALLVSNHSSLLDPPIVGGASPRRLCFMAKAELFRIPLFGRLIRALNARPVRREGASAQALREALATLRAGQALLVFPEGTRGPETEIRPAKPGAGMLAVMSGAPVIPVYISGSGRAFPRGRVAPRPAKVIVRFGPALSFADGADAGRDRYREAAQEMTRAIARLRDQAQQEAGGPAQGAVTAPMQDRISG